MFENNPLKFRFHLKRFFFNRLKNLANTPFVYILDPVGVGPSLGSTMPLF